MTIPDDGAGEGERERRDRELDELSGELRTVLPGATVLFAFLLTVPFSSGFARLQGVDRLAFFVAFVATGAAIVLLLGEGAYHRVIGHPYDKERLLATASRQAIAALVLLAVALAAAAFLVADLLYSRGAAVAVSGGLLGLAVATWFALPLARRASRR